MKKISLMLTLLLTIFTLGLLFSCSSTATYTVIYESNGGSQIASVTVYEGDKVDAPTEPILAYYDFQGWYTSEDLTTAFDFDSEVNANITLYAKWAPKSFTVSFDTGYAGATVTDQTVVYPGTADAPAIPVRPSYNFIEWKLDGQTYDFDETVIGDITLTADWTCDYAFTLTDDEIYITAYTGDVETIDMPDSLDGYPIVGIAEGLFSNYDELTEISLPASLESISANLFYGCDSLLEITLPETVTVIGAEAFKNSAMSLINLGSSLVTIGVSAFENCDGLLGVVIPESTITIGNASFKNCSTLTSIIIGTSVTTIGEYAFYNCQDLLNVILPDSVTSIGRYAFSRCISLQSAFLGDGITIIPENAFDNCISLETLEFGSSLLEIKQYAFLYCTSLIEISIPDSVTTIAPYAFNGCSGLISLYIGSGIETIGAMAFAGCTNLVNITINAIIAPTAGSDIFLNISPLHSVLVNSEAEGYEGGVWDTLNIEIFYTVNFDIGYEGGTNPESQIVAYMGKATTPQVNPRSGFTFLGWYSDISRTILFDFNTEITSNRTLYGLWSELYDIEINNNTVTILGFQEGISQSNLNIPAQLRSMPVVAIANGAFKDDTTLTHVTLPDSVSSIGEEAFSRCVNLISVRLGSSLASIGDSAFYSCSSLEGLALPASVTSIGANTFENCTYLIGITLGANLNSIGDGAFKGCTNIETMVIPANLKTIGNEAFSGCTKLLSINLPSGMTGIGENAFRNCSNITLMPIPLSVTSIGDGTFYGCAKLESVTMGLVTAIGSEAFYGCAALDSITLPISLVSLGGYAFYGCESLGSINIPLLLVNINEYTFYGCSALTTITVNAPILSIGQYAFYQSGLTSFNGGNVLTNIGSHAFGLCEDLQSVTLPNTVVNIGEYAFVGSGLTAIDLPDNELFVILNGYVFNNCSALASVSMPANLLTINQFAFSGCSALTAITLPDTLRDIEAYAFYNCSALETVTFGPVVRSIGNYAFSGCTALTELALPTTFTTLGTNAFRGDTALTNVSLPKALTVISESAFEGCSALVDVTLGSSVIEIGSRAFAGCVALPEIDIPATIETIGVDAFENNNSMVFVMIRALEAPVVGTFLDPIVFGINEAHVIFVPFGSEGYENIHNPLNDWGNYWSTYTIDVFYTVNFDLNYYGAPEAKTVSDEYAIQDVLNGAAIIAPQIDPIFDYGTFVKWAFDAEGLVDVDYEEIISENKTIYAIWDFDQFTVTFDKNGATSEDIDPQTVDYGDWAIEPSVPEKSGYDFIGWYLNETIYDFETPVTEDIALIAEFIQVFTVSFDVNGAESPASIDDQIVRDGGTASIPTEVPELTGYNFIGWQLDSAPYDFGTPVVEDITLMAEFEIKTFTVTFDIGDGTTENPIPNQTIPYEGLIDDPEEPELEGFVFTGWFFEGALFDLDTPITEDVDLVAGYAELFTVTFNLNGGELIGLVEEQLVQDGDYVIEPSPEPELDGFTFDGWYLGEEAFDFMTYQVTGDITLVARYSPI